MGLTCWQLGGATVAAASGVDDDVDPSFGTNGYVELSVPSQLCDCVAMDVLAQPDGRIVVLVWAVYGAGLQDVLVYRLLATGEPDAGFGYEGRVYVIFPTLAKRPVALALQADGKILVAATMTNSTRDFAIARLTAAGEIDTTFNGDGYAIFDLEPGVPDTDDEVSALAVQADQKIVVVGVKNLLSGDKRYIIALRLLTNGELDGSYGIGGINYGDFNLGWTTSYSNANAVAIDSTGRAVVAGSWGDGAGQSNWVVSRLTTAGYFDTSFDSDGIVRGDWTALEPLSEYSDITDLLIRSDGSYLFVGETSIANLQVVGTQAVMRPDGVLDPTFHGGDGASFLEFLPMASSSTDLRVAFDRSGMAIVSGQATTDASYLGLVRTQDGTYHPQFRPDGNYVLEDAPGQAGFQLRGGIALDPEDRIVVAGSSQILQDPPVSALKGRPFLTRLRGTLIFTDGFESGGLSRWN